MNNTLYTFRRCPYAIRARFAIYTCGFPCDEIQVVLKDKPARLLELSPKGTVPVLELHNGTVIDESLDIIKHVLSNEKKHPLLENTPEEAWALIHKNDTTFKQALDRYKYPNRYENDDIDHPKNAEDFLTALNQHLEKNAFLFGDNLCVADIAIFPFIRQYRGVNMESFDARKDLKNLHAWLHQLLNSDTFINVMKKKS